MNDIRFLVSKRCPLSNIFIDPLRIVISAAIGGDYSSRPEIISGRSQVATCIFRAHSGRINNRGCRAARRRDLRAGRERVALSRS